MKSGIIHLHDAANYGLRMDASLHLSDGIRARQKIANLPYSKERIGACASRIFFGNRNKRVYVTNPEHGLPFLTGAAMFKADMTGLKLISQIHTKDIEDCILDKGWVLITRSGTVGKCSFSNGIYKGLGGSEDIIRIISNSRMPAEVIYAYLASRIGYSLLTQGTFGSVIQHIEPDYVAAIQIPIFPETLQKRVQDLIQVSSRLREEADKARNKATAFFEKYDVTIKNHIFSKRISQLGFSWAAYNNNLSIDAIHQKYEENKVTLSSLSESIFCPPLFKHIYLDKDNGHPFLTGRELMFQNQRYYRWLSPLGVRDINEYTVEKGTLLLYKSGTTDGDILGNVLIVDDNLHGACLSDHVIRIKMKDINDAYWAYAFLRSKAGVILLQGLATGTMIAFITPDRVAKLTIPAPNEDYKVVSALIAEYLDKRIKSNRMENEAIQLVEEEIEKWQES